MIISIFDTDMLSISMSKHYERLRIHNLVWIRIWGIMGRNIESTQLFLDGNLV